MKSVKTIYILVAVIIGLFIIDSISAQSNSYQNMTNIDDSFEDISFKGDSTNFKPKISVSLSTSFSSFGYGYNAMSTSIMPKVTFPVTNRLSLTAGVGYSTIFMNGTNSSLFDNGPTNYGHLFVSGDYMLTRKITIRGTAYKTLNLDSKPQMGTETNYPYLDFSSQGIIMDVEYKVTDNFKINVGVEYREQKYPSYGPGINPLNTGIGSGNSFFDFNHSNGQGLTPF